MDCVANFPWCVSKGGAGEERKKKTNERETRRERASKREKEWTRETLRVAPSNDGSLLQKMGLFCRALLPKRPIISRSLLTLRVGMSERLGKRACTSKRKSARTSEYEGSCVCVCACTFVCVCVCVCVRVCVCVFTFCL